MKILIVKLSAIGDVIHTLPALNAIRTTYPEAYITWLVEAAAADLLIGHPALDRVLISHRKEWLKGIWGHGFMQKTGAIKKFISSLRDTRYDIVIDFQGLFKSGLLVGLSRAERKIGFSRGMDHMEGSYLFYNERVPPIDMDVHALTRGLMLIETIGVHSRKIEYNIPITSQDRTRVCDLLQANGIGPEDPFVTMNPMAKWETKLWGAEKWAQLATTVITRRRLKVVFSGAPADREPISGILAQGVPAGSAVNLAGATTLKMLAALYEQAKCVISTDSGPMHLAAALDVPLVALFGPTAPWRTGPFGEGHRVIRLGLECSPCFKRRCPNPRCMQQIDVETVYTQVEAALDSKES